MPVIDHPVHEKTAIDKTHRYHCWNGERPKQGSIIHSEFSGESWPYRMSSECRYDLSVTDPSCSECKHRGSGEDYSHMIRASA